MPTVQKKNNKQKNYIAVVGRRREAVARVRLYNLGKGEEAEIFGAKYKAGDTIVNGKTIGEYFRFHGYIPVYKRIFDDTDTLGKFLISAKVEGGGITGQLDAFVHGVARALDKLDKEAYHAILREHGYLTRDPRTRERRKVGTGGKARRKKQSPKR